MIYRQDDPDAWPTLVELTGVESAERCLKKYGLYAAKEIDGTNLFFNHQDPAYIWQMNHVSLE